MTGRTNSRPGRRNGTAARRGRRTGTRSGTGTRTWTARRTLAVAFALLAVLAVGVAPVAGGVTSGTDGTDDAEPAGTATPLPEGRVAAGVGAAATVTPGWRTNLTNATGAARSLGVESGLAARGGLVYVPGASGGENRLTALDAATGEVRWSRALGSGYPRGLSAVADGPAPSGTDPLWAPDARSVPEDAFASTPPSRSGDVYVGDYAGTLYALAPEAGATNWTAHTGFGSYVGDPAVGNRSVLATAVDPVTGTTHLQAYARANGSRLRSVELGTGYGLARPAGAGEFAAVPVGETLYGVDLSAREVAWTVDLGSSAFGAPAVVGAGEAVAVSTADGRVRAVALSTGQRLWSADVGPTATAPVAGDGRVVVGGDRLYALDASGGTTLWRTSVGTPTGPATLADGRAYAPTEEGVAVVDAATGESLGRTTPTFAPVVAPPVRGEAVVAADPDGLVGRDRFEPPVNRSATLALDPASATVDAGGSTTVDVVLRDAALGVDAYSFTVETTNGSTVRVVNATPRGDPELRTVTPAPDGSTVTVSADLVNLTTVTTLATVTVEGDAVGTADLRLVDVDVTTAENATPARSYDLSTENATVTVRDPDAAPLLPGASGPAGNVDDDPALEDVNGNGDLTLADVTLLFENRGAAAVTDSPDAFDYNGNGDFTLADVTSLFLEAASG